MAKASKKISLSNCTINLEDMTITETVGKEDVRFHDINKILQDLVSMGSFNITYDNKTDYMDIETE